MLYGVDHSLVRGCSRSVCRSRSPHIYVPVRGRVFFIHICRAFKTFGCPSWCFGIYKDKTERVESTRRRYGEFQNVFLSGEECSRLETAYPGKAAEYIERLSRYMASNDRHYANHYATIKKWLDEDSKGRSAKNYTYDDNEGECL